MSKRAEFLNVSEIFYRLSQIWGLEDKPIRFPVCTFSDGTNKKYKFTDYYITGTFYPESGYIIGHPKLFGKHVGRYDFKQQWVPDFSELYYERLIKMPINKLEIPKEVFQPAFFIQKFIKAEAGRCNAKTLAIYHKILGNMLLSIENEAIRTELFNSLVIFMNKEHEKASQLPF